MRTKEKYILFVIVLAALLFAAFDGLTGKAGNLNPSGPPQPTMVTLEQISSQIEALSSPVNRVIHGVITFGKWSASGAQTFSPAVDPNRCIVLLSDAVAFNCESNPNDSWIYRTGACLIELTGTQITVRVEGRAADQKVSYQIIEYK